MARDAFDICLDEINEAYLRRDATKHMHRPALKKLIDAPRERITAVRQTADSPGISAAMGEPSRAYARAWLVGKMDWAHFSAKLHNGGRGISVSRGSWASLDPGYSLYYEPIL